MKADTTGLCIQNVRRWVESVVIDLNLCPFARRELVNGRVRFVVSQADTEALLLQDLQSELALLDLNSSVETTLLIHPHVLNDFHEYNAFFTRANRLLSRLKYIGIYQLASFHPDYEFAQSNVDDPENYTNRSPYPLLHLLREASLEQAIAKHADVHGIPARNMDLMRKLGSGHLQQLFAGLKRTNSA